MVRIMAQGMFDILHPGHIHYLRESAEYGDELYVVVAADERAQNRNQVMGEEDRRTMVEALEMVDKAVIGDANAMFSVVQDIKPDVITLGYDQTIDEPELRELLSGYGMDDIEILRIDAYDGPVKSSGQLKAKLADCQ